MLRPDKLNKTTEKLGNTPLSKPYLRDELISKAKNLPAGLGFNAISEFSLLDARIGCANCYLHFVFGMNLGFIEFCPNNDPPSNDELLTYLWIASPNLAREIANELENRHLAAAILNLR